MLLSTLPRYHDIAPQPSGPVWHAFRLVAGGEKLSLYRCVESERLWVLFKAELLASENPCSKADSDIISKRLRKPSNTLSSLFCSHILSVSARISSARLRDISWASRDFRLLEFHQKLCDNSWDTFFCAHGTNRPLCSTSIISSRGTLQ